MHDALTIGIPTLVILIGILFNRTELRDFKADMNRRFEEVNGRFERVDRRFNEVVQHFERRSDGIEHRLDGIDKRLSVMEGDLKMFDRISSKLEGRVDELSRR